MSWLEDSPLTKLDQQLVDALQSISADRSAVILCRSFCGYGTETMSQIIIETYEQTAITVLNHAVSGHAFLLRPVLLRLRESMDHALRATGAVR